MKEIKAFIKPGGVHKVVTALKGAGFESATLSKGEGTGTYKSDEASLSLDFHFTDSPIVKLELVCQDEESEKVVKIISENARTTFPADGIVYVSHIEDALKIKTGKSIKRLK